MSALAGVEKWDDLLVQQELKWLFRADSQEVLEKFLYEARTELWGDAW